PATILSRCQRHDFRRIPPEIIAERLKVVCGGEDIKIEDKAIDLIARLSNGALRDALSILEVCVGDYNPSENKLISFDYVSKVSGYFDVEKMVSLCVCIKDGDAEQALRLFWEMYDNSFDCVYFCASLLEMFRNIQIAKIVQEPYQYINLDRQEAELIVRTAKSFDSADLLRCYSLISEVYINLNRYTANKRVAVEMLLVEMCIKNIPLNPAVMPVSQNAQIVHNVQKSGNFDKYADLIEEVGKENKMIAPYLKSGRCIIDENAKKITIYSDSDFKVNLLKDPKNILVIQKNLAKFVSGDYAVAIELQKPDSQETEHKNSIDDINM
ncbi:MAG: hypothetical protein FWD71_15170, partial [Oscillospiraceae bacterium]|nr:hypothetical protein [Oscillospiraceae bacterium]